MAGDHRRGLDAAQLVHRGCRVLMAVGLGGRGPWTQIFAQPLRELRQGFLVWDAAVAYPSLAGRGRHGDVTAVGLAVHTGYNLAADDLTIARVTKVPVCALPAYNRRRTEPLLHLRAPRRRICLDYHEAGSKATAYTDITVAMVFLRDPHRDL